MVSPELIRLLCCPETHQEVRLADNALLARLNREITLGQLKNRTGRPVRHQLDGGLLREDGKLLYPVRGEIPVMLIEEAIPLT